MKTYVGRPTNIEPMTTFLIQKRLRLYGHALEKEGDDTTEEMN